MNQSRARNSPDRRAATRPRNGDAQRCPHCATGTMEFSERVRLNGVATPAWTCDNPTCSIPCSLVRRNVDPSVAAASAEALIETAKAVRASALRTAMRSKARVARTRRIGRKN